ncbi:hypothetical protein ACRS8P_10880 [Burkholderia cenocepacia]
MRDVTRHRPPAHRAESGVVRSGGPAAARGIDVRSAPPAMLSPPPFAS